MHRKKIIDRICYDLHFLCSAIEQQQHLDYPFYNIKFIHAIWIIHFTMLNSFKTEYIQLHGENTSENGSIFLINRTKRIDPIIS
jgi:hypothetical protein